MTEELEQFPVGEKRAKKKKGVAKKTETLAESQELATPIELKVAPKAAPAFVEAVEVPVVEEPEEEEILSPVVALEPPPAAEVLADPAWEALLSGLNPAVMSAVYESGIFDLPTLLGKTPRDLRQPNGRLTSLQLTLLIQALAKQGLQLMPSPLPPPDPVAEPRAVSTGHAQSKYVRHVVRTSPPMTPKKRCM
jgi:hypothetical protein